MQTLSYGYLKPQTGDKGSVFFPALESNIQQLNDHTHNDANSAKLTAASSVVVAQNVSSAGWSSTSGGRYRQAVTLSGGLNYDDVVITIKDQTSKNVLLLGIEKIDATSFYVYTIDNTIALTINYTS